MAVDISTLDWATVQDRRGNVRAGRAYTITSGSTTVLSGVTNADGQMTGSLEAGEYTLSVAGVVTKSVVVPANATSQATDLTATQARITTLENFQTASGLAVRTGANSVSRSSEAPVNLFVVAGTPTNGINGDIWIDLT